MSHTRQLFRPHMVLYVHAYLQCNTISDHAFMLMVFFFKVCFLVTLGVLRVWSFIAWEEILSNLHIIVNTQRDLPGSQRLEHGSPVDRRNDVNNIHTYPICRKLRSEQAMLPSQYCRQLLAKFKCAKN